MGGREQAAAANVSSRCYNPQRFTSFLPAQHDKAKPQHGTFAGAACETTSPKYDGCLHDHLRLRPTSKSGSPPAADRVGRWRGNAPHLTRIVDKKNVWNEALTFHFSPLSFCANRRLELGIIPIFGAVIMTILWLSSLSFTGSGELLLDSDYLSQLVSPPQFLDQPELVPTAFSIAK